MKLSLLLFYSLLTCIIVTSSCSKKSSSSTDAIDGVTPLRTSIATKYPADTIYTMPANIGNFGLKFHATSPGIITQLGCRMPSPGIYEVILFDYDANTLIAKANVVVTNGNDFAYTPISSVSIVVNKFYVVSVNNASNGVGQRYFQLFKKPTTIYSIYPFRVKQITIDMPFSSTGNSSVFPRSNNISDYPFIRGVPDFVFEPAAR